MSFWRTFGFHTVSAIDTILDKDEFTLEELLDEEEILQEVKSQNKRLLEFLTQPDMLRNLIQFISVEPVSTEEESKRKFKYPFLACEILCSDVWSICDAIYKDRSLVQALYSFLETDKPLNHQLANYVCRTAGVLLQRKIAETIEFMKERNMIQHFIKHLSNASVMDLLLKVIACEETAEGGGVLNWLCNTDLIPCLVGKFASSNGPEVHENAAQALVDIISVSGAVASSPLIRQLESAPIVTTLYDHILSSPPPSSALLSGLTVVIELLARNAAMNANKSDNDDNKIDDVVAANNVVEGVAAAAAAAVSGQDAAPAPSSTSSTASTSTTADLAPLLAQTLARMPALAQLFDSPPGPKRPMTFGSSVEFLGFDKLKIFELFAMVARMNNPALDAELVRLNFFSSALDAFFKYAWNNFLHATFEQIVGGVLDGDNAVLQAALLTKAQLPARIATSAAFNAVEEAKPRGVRRGYMGHLIAIGVRLQQAAARSPTLAAAINANEGWSAYEAGAFADARLAQTKPLGGQRPMGGPGESSDDEEEEQEIDEEGDSIFDRYQLGFGNEEFGDDDGEGDIHFDENDGNGDSGDGAGHEGGAPTFEVYGDGDGDGDGDSDDWQKTDSNVEIADVDAIVDSVQKTEIDHANAAAAAAAAANANANAVGDANANAATGGAVSADNGNNASPQSE